MGFCDFLAMVSLIFTAMSVWLLVGFTAKEQANKTLDLNSTPCTLLCDQLYSLETNSLTCCLSTWDCKTKQTCQQQLIRQYQKNIHELIIIIAVNSAFIVCLLSYRSYRYCSRRRQIARFSKFADDEVLRPTALNQGLIATHSKVNRLRLSHPISQQKERCAICWQGYECVKGVELDCKHKFHGQCIKLWIFQKETCPVCRQRA